MRDTVEAFIARGGNAAFFSGNTSLWQVRIEGDDHDVMVGYKGFFKDDPLMGTDREPEVTTFWSDVVVGRPENHMTGVSFTRGGYHRIGRNVTNGLGGYTVHRAGHWIFDGTGLGYGDVLGAGATVVGYECDGCVFTYRDGLPYPTGEDGTPSTFEILGTCPTQHFTRETAPRPPKPGEPSELEYIASRVFGTREPEAMERIRHGHAVLGAYTNDAGATVVTSGSTDWAHGLAGARPADRADHPQRAHAVGRARGLPRLVVWPTTKRSPIGSGSAWVRSRRSPSNGCLEDWRSSSEGTWPLPRAGRAGCWVRVDPADTEALLSRAGVRPMEMRGRAMRGWLRVDPDAVRTKRQLTAWIDRGVTYACDVAGQEALKARSTSASCPTTGRSVSSDAVRSGRRRGARRDHHENWCRTSSKIVFRWSCTVYADSCNRSGDLAVVENPCATSSVTSRSRSVNPYASAIERGELGTTRRLQQDRDRRGRAPRRGAEPRTTSHRPAAGADARAGDAVAEPAVRSSSGDRSDGDRGASEPGRPPAPELVEQPVGGAVGHLDDFVGREHEQAGLVVTPSRRVVEERGARGGRRRAVRPATRRSARPGR